MSFSFHAYDVCVCVFRDGLVENYGKKSFRVLPTHQYTIKLFTDDTRKTDATLRKLATFLVVVFVAVAVDVVKKIAIANVV